MIPVRSQWGRYNLPRSIIITIMINYSNQIVELADTVGALGVKPSSMSCWNLWQTAMCNPWCVAMSSMNGRWLWIRNKLQVWTSLFRFELLFITRLWLVPFLDCANIAAIILIWTAIGRLLSNTGRVRTTTSKPMNWEAQASWKITSDASKKQALFHPVSGAKKRSTFSVLHLECWSSNMSCDV